MKVSLRLLIGGVVLVGATAVASAQDASIAAQTPPREIGVDGAAVLPVGDYGDVATLGVGALGRIDFPLNDRISITGRLGVVFHMLDEGVEGSLTLVPIYGGARYFVQGGNQGPYAAGEAGITIGFAEVDTPFGTASDSESEIGATLGGGFKRGALDIRGGLFIPDLGEADDLAIMGSVGFGFATF
jgi:hypothetical protein